MVSFRSWRRKGTDAPKLKPRASNREANRIVSGQAYTLAPQKREYLGRAGGFALLSFQWRSRMIAAAPTVALKQRLAPVAEQALRTHERLSEELRRMRVKPEEAINDYWPDFDRLMRAVRTDDWHEQLLACYLMDGLLGDLFIALAPGVGSDGQRVAELFEDDPGIGVMFAVLAEQLAPDGHLTGRMALWGRRLVGDTLLLARSSYRLPDDPAEAEARVTAAFSDLVAGHTRRMDALGLTA